MAVEGGIRRGDVARRLIAGERNDPYVAVGGGGLLAIMIGVEGEFAAVRREVVAQGAAELEGRGIEVAGRQVAHGAGGNIGQQDMRVLSVPPFRPVAVEKRVGQVRVQRALAPALIDFLYAGIVGVAL